MALWRIRAALEDEPGRLAAITAAIAACGCNVFGFSVQTHEGGPVDEFFVSTPEEISRFRLIETVSRAGGTQVTAVPADPHDLVDAPTKALQLAAALLAAPDTLPDIMADLLGADDAWWDEGTEGVADATVLIVPVPDGRRVAVVRQGLPFTMTEAARAGALAALGR
ncbi:hypothetical protein ABIA31_008780 [Catenulispora sp. MAP5-51]|jgi:hypothetical protein|uniref:hypothetical protein n=1 Tax=Catenulispora sp. MAP5-51 TaxID=3156298 RepID=UPI003514FCF5